MEITLTDIGNVFIFTDKGGDGPDDGYKVFINRECILIGVDGPFAEVLFRLDPGYTQDIWHKHYNHGIDVVLDTGIVTMERSFYKTRLTRKGE